MKQDYPVPPPELIAKWASGMCGYHEAARWGYRQAMEPEPEKPSLKEQALEALEHIVRYSSTDRGAETIRRALEQLPDQPASGGDCDHD